MILLDQNLEFVAFGYEAQDVYADKATDKEHEEYRLFQHFTLPFCNPDVVSCLYSNSDILVLGCLIHFPSCKKNDKNTNYLPLPVDLQLAGSTCRIWVPIAQVPSHCLLLSSIIIMFLCMSR